MRRAAVFVLASLPLLTSGCIAAAIPLVAGAGLVKSQGDRDKPRGDAPPALAAAAARSDLKVVPTSLTALPPPGSRAPGLGAVAAFRSYALTQAELPPEAGKRPSAILPTASELLPDRSDCGALPAAVFVDLDPGRAAFDPLVPGAADPALGPALGELRQSGVRVVWLSRLGANFTAAVRAALVEGGLDPAGQDELILMRDLGERKQSRRDEVARRLCPIAMLGDERADFDELYLYLKNPDAAVALDAMIDKGWFLASPFAAPAAPDAGATP